MFHPCEKSETFVFEEVQIIFESMTTCFYRKFMKIDYVSFEWYKHTFLIQIVPGRYNSNVNLGPWRMDNRCGRDFPSDGRPAECNPNGKSPCCSSHGWCGGEIGHCRCDTCVDYRNGSQGDDELRGEMGKLH